MKSKEIREWGECVIEELKEYTNLGYDKFVLLAGEKYRRHLLPHIKNYEIPLQGLKIGEQLSWLKQKIKL